MGFLERIGRRLRTTDGKAEAAADREVVVARMRDLVAAGRCREALEFALPHALRLDDPALHREVAHLRRDAAAEAIAGARPRPDWPPRFADPFPDVDGIPEIDVADFTSEVMAGAIQHHGSLIVRGLLACIEAKGMADQIQHAFDGFDAVAEGVPAEDVARWFSLFDIDPNGKVGSGRGWCRAGGGVLAADSPAVLNRLTVLFREKGLVEAIAGYLHEEPMLSVGKTVLRRVDPTRAGDFHQDGAFLGADVRTINVWTALSDCGVDSPGLEIVDRRVPQVLETGTDGAFLYWTIGRDLARRANGDRPFARPTFAAGDAIVFDHLMVHATSHDDAMYRPRYAIESWFFAPSAYAEKEVAIAI